MTDSTLPLFPPPGRRPEEHEAACPGTRPRPFSVSEINATARDLLEDSFADVWVQGEISNFKAHGSGHFYFSLKDERSQLNAVMFRSVNLHIRFKPSDGLSVLARGRITLYEARGTYQLNTQWMEPLGIGSLQLAFEQLKAKLQAEGLFDPDRKRLIPALPKRIGVVTSPTGAAISDILRVLERRYASLHVLIAPCRVQGEGAAREIARAIEDLNAHSARSAGREPGPLDVIIVSRGGGSLEDLWAFNEETVARAIAASGLPVISAVGHEIDFTIADFVSDLRAPTPSAAAEMVIRSREELVSRVEAAWSRLAQAARVQVLNRRNQVQSLERSRAFTRVEAMLSEAQQRCDEASMRLASALLSGVRRFRERVGIAKERLSPRSLRAELAVRSGRVSAAAQILVRSVHEKIRALREQAEVGEAVLRSLSPLAVLERGYAICQEARTGKVIKDAALLSPGKEVRVRLSRGRIGARVTEVQLERPREER